MTNLKIINSKALLNNLSFVKGKAKDVMVMVKADAYGHGVKNIVHILNNKVNYWGVANLKEAQELKKYALKTSQILIVGKTSNYKQAAKAAFHVTVDEEKDLIKINKSLINTKIVAKVHIKINTGMNRLGVKTLAEFKRMLNIINKSKNILFCGIFTHFFDADDENSNVYKQLKTFKKFVNIVKDKDILIHVGGSYAILHELPKYINMVRAGIFIYGYGNKNLTPVMQIQSQILKITHIKRGEYVGYGKTMINKNKKIALVPIGYADGVLKGLSNTKCAIICGKKCKTIGKICMDMLMVDVTNIKCKVGHTVTILKDANLLAKILNTSVYEILTNFKNVRAKYLVV